MQASSPHPAPGAARRAALGLALLVLLALVLRWPAVSRLLPHAPEPDAYFVQLAQDWRGDPARIQHVDYAERYPVLLARLLCVLPWPSPTVDPGRPGDEARLLEAGSGAYLAARRLVLALSLLMIPGTWLVARRLAGERAAWIAAALVATSMLQALFSTQARPHAAQAALAVLAVWAAMRLAERAVPARAVAAVALASLALATLQIGAATLPPLALASWIAGGPLWRRAARAALLPLAAVAGAAWAYPFALDLRERGLRLGGSGAHEVDFAAADGSGFQELVRRLADHDPALLALLAAALAGALVRWRASARALTGNKDVAVACAYALPYLAVVGPLNEVFERFLLPLLPWIATFGAALVVRLAGHSARRAVAFGAAAAVAPLLVLVHFARVCARPDTAEVARAWIESDPERRAARFVLSPGLVLPAPFDAASLEAALQDRAGRSSVWPAYQGTRPATEFPATRVAQYMTPAVLSQRPAEGLAEWVDATAPDYIVLERTRRNRFLAGGRELASLASERGTLAFATDGSAPGIEEQGLLHYQSMDGYVRRLLRAERFGAPLQVWRLGP
ncbi:MAG: glycosyltransferase family 39 protein [Planctomycetes bacterium]|nr:glycosyltransferase family 39 protein [Planctomycetota bacterium]